MSSVQGHTNLQRATALRRGNEAAGNNVEEEREGKESSQSSELSDHSFHSTLDNNVLSRSFHSAHSGSSSDDEVDTSRHSTHVEGRKTD